MKMKLKKGVLKNPMVAAAKVGMSIAKAPVRAMKKGMAKAALSGAIAGGMKKRTPMTGMQTLQKGMKKLNKRY